MMEPKVVAIPQSIHEEGLEFGGVFQGGFVHDGLVLQLLACSPGASDTRSVARAAAAESVSVSEHLGFPYGKGEGLAADVDLVRHGVSAESRERIHEAGRELAALGPWTVPELLLHLQATEDAAHEEGTDELQGFEVTDPFPDLRFELF